MSRIHISSIARVFLCIGACLALTGWQSPVVGATPGQSPAADALAQDSLYRARLYEGDCETIALADALATDESSRESGSDETGWSYSFAMSVEGAIDDVISAPHAISIETVVGDLATSLACGELGGEIVGERLIAPLITPESGELAGIAILSEGEDEIAVVVFLVLSADGTPFRSADETEPNLDGTDNADDVDDSIDDGDMIDEGGV